MRISDWSSDVCSSDLAAVAAGLAEQTLHLGIARLGGNLVNVCLGDSELLGGDQGVQCPGHDVPEPRVVLSDDRTRRLLGKHVRKNHPVVRLLHRRPAGGETAALVGVDVAPSGVEILLVLLARGADDGRVGHRSEEHPSELQSLMRTSSAVFCLKTKK